MSVNIQNLLIASLTWPLSCAWWLARQLRYRLSRRVSVSTGAVGGPLEMSDPRRGDNEGPPDLDEILKKVNQKISGLFGRPGGGADGGGGGGSSGGQVLGGGLAIAGGLAVMIWLASGFYTVDSGRQGLELRFGRFTRVTEPGPNWHWPFPIESVEIVNTQQIEVVEVGHRNNQRQKVKEEALMLTEDQNIVDLQFAVQYTLSDARDFQFRNKDPREAVRQVAETSMREIVGKSKMDFVLYEGRADIALRAKALMQKLLDRYSSGINIATVTMQNAQPPADVQASFDDAVRAKQDRERLKNEGEAYANDILPKAKGNAARLMEEANGYKQSVIANAQGDAARFTQILSEYEKAPAVTRERLYIDAMQQIMRSTSKVIVDQKGGQNLLYLPLDKLLQVGASQPPGSVPEARPAPPPATDPSAAVSVEASRVRDLRSRDR